MTFISSTAVLEAKRYAQQSDELINQGEQGISEAELLDGVDLCSGYAQTKWVSEQLMLEAGRRGLQGSVVRVGYVLGDSVSGACITDDLLIRMLKQCVQLQSRPRIDNSMNMVPVDYAARLIVAAALHPPTARVCTVHVTPHPRITWTQYLGSLEKFGYDTPIREYSVWKQPLERYMAAAPGQKGARVVDHAM